MIGNTSKTDQRVLNAQHEQCETTFASKLKMLGAEPSYPALSSGRVSRRGPRPPTGRSLTAALPSSLLLSFPLKASVRALAELTPYQTEHINRFGNYTVNFSRTPEPLPTNLRNQFKVSIRQTLVSSSQIKI